jgi:hypothetical protein
MATWVAPNRTGRDEHRFLALFNFSLK